MNTRAIAAECRLSHWAQVMEDRKESGLSIRAYCEGKGMHENVYYYWQKKLRGAAFEQMATLKAEGAVPHIFTEVRLTKPAPQMLCLEASRQGGICIEVAGARISTDCTYPVGMLAVLLKEVAQPC